MTAQDRMFFIQTNESQYLGALLSKFSIERFLSPEDRISVEILNVEKIPAFQTFVGKTYIQGSEKRTYAFSDEQSFTLSRFMPPKLMNYRGRAVVIDPDVFAVSDPRSIFDIEMHNAAVACCIRKEPDFWDTSFMLLENAQLKWDIQNILEKLAAQRINYNVVMRKVLNEPIMQIPRIWNTLDTITSETKFIHYTRQRTQPWKTGLPYTVTPRKLGKLFGVIPLEWLPQGRAKYPARYQPHPDAHAELFFFSLLQEALTAGAVSRAIIEDAVAHGHIRGDIFKKIEHYEKA